MKRRGKDSTAARTNSSMSPTLGRLIEILRKESLQSPRAFLALRQHVIAMGGDQRGVYGQATLEKGVGVELRKALPNHFQSKTLTPQLKAAIRFAKAYTPQAIRAIERRTAAANPYRVGRTHLQYIGSACTTKNERDAWIDKCFQNRWSARTLHDQLKQKFKQPRSQGGRLLPTPAAGLRALESAVKSLQRLFEHDSINRHWNSMSPDARAALQQRLAQCRMTIQKLEKVKGPPIAKR